MIRAWSYLILGVSLVACRGARKSAPRDAAPGAATDALAASVTLPPETIVLDEVEVHLRGVAETALVGRALGRDLARCLVESNRVVALADHVPSSRTPRPARLRIEVAAEPGAVSEGCPDPCQRIAVVMDAQLSWEPGGDPAPSATVSGDATPIAGNTNAAVLAITMRLEDAVCSGIGARIAVWTSGDLLPSLTGTDPGAALWALQLAANRPRQPGLVDAITGWLQRGQPWRNAAITALVALGDPASVPALTAITDWADRSSVTTIVEAVTAIGGDDAHEFLEFVTSHRDPTVADHAREGLERLARRAEHLAATPN